MTNKRHFFGIILGTALVCLSTSCRKEKLEGTIMVNGKVIDGLTNQGVENIQIFISTPPKIGSAGDFYQLGTADTTDAAGSFRCEYTSILKQRYCLILNDPHDTALYNKYRVINRDVEHGGYGVFATIGIDELEQENYRLVLGRIGRLKLIIKANSSFSANNFFITGVSDYSTLQNIDTLYT